MSDKSIAVANEFIELARKDGKFMSNLLLHKLLYLVQGYWLLYENEPMFEDRMEAWTHGPVAPELHYDIKMRPINPKQITEPMNGAKVSDEKKKELIKAVYEKYGNRDPWGLVAATHKKGSPWTVTLEKGRTVIDNELIRQEFASL